MTLIPPVVLVLDITALVSSSQREWREFSRVGRAHIPQAIYEEMKMLFDRSPDPDLEELSKSFNHFYPTSGWQITEAHAHHSTLTVAGYGLTHRTRIALAAARCAYALALDAPSHMVVLVTRNQLMWQRIGEIALVNLCAVDAGELLQWSRTGQRPIVVTKQLQQLRLAIAEVSPAGMVGSSQVRTSPSRLTATSDTRSSSARSASTRSSQSRPASRPTPYRPVQSAPRSQMRAARDLPGWIPQFVSLGLALGCVAIAGWVLWGVIHKDGWLEFLRQPADPVQPQSK